MRKTSAQLWGTVTTDGLQEQSSDERRSPYLLDTQAGYGSGDDELLNLAGAFEDRVAHRPGFSWCGVVWRRGRDQVLRELMIPPRVTVSTRF